MARLTTVFTAALALILPLPAAAQDTPPALPSAGAPPAYLAYVEGAVDLIHEGATERADADAMLVDGDVVRTANGRAEIVFADGSVLHLDHDTELEILSLLRSRLITGRVLLRVSAAASDPYVIDTQAASNRLLARGEYDLTADSRTGRLEVLVTRGSVEIDNGATTTVVRGGEKASIPGADGRVLVSRFNAARFDAFERWSRDRVDGFARYSSASLLPTELRAYSSYFDSYGRWDYVEPYGNVWFPAVHAGWRPYYAGSWRLTRYGWTWFGHDPWAWPTHHFGRWGFTGAAWYWIPHRVWGPAWVSWAFVPGYVSWAPLGWNNRAVIGWGHRGDHPVYWPHYDVHRVWTVVPRHGFGHRRPVRDHAIDPRKLPEPTRRALAGFAVPRGPSSAVVSPNVDRAVPRDAARPRAADVPGVADLSRRPRAGNARSPEAAPRAGSRRAPLDSPSSLMAPPPATGSGGAVERPGRSVDRRDNDRTVDTPRVYTPRSPSSSQRADDPPPRRRPDAAARPHGTDNGGARVRPAPRSDSSRRGAPAGVAVPRAGSPQQTAAPPRSGASAGAQGGAARRRPPQ